jgi:hypothetical protein
MWIGLYVAGAPQGVAMAMAAAVLVPLGDDVHQD